MPHWAWEHLPHVEMTQTTHIPSPPNHHNGTCQHCKVPSLIYVTQKTSFATVAHAGKPSVISTQMAPGMR